MILQEAHFAPFGICNFAMEGLRLWSPGGPIGRSRSNSGTGLLAVELSLVIG